MTSMARTRRVRAGARTCRVRAQAPVGTSQRWQSPALGHVGSQCAETGVVVAVPVCGSPRASASHRP